MLDAGRFGGLSPKDKVDQYWNDVLKTAIDEASGGSPLASRATRRRSRGPRRGWSGTGTPGTASSPGTTTRSALIRLPRPSPLRITGPAGQRDDATRVDLAAAIRIMK